MHPLFDWLIPPRYFMALSAANIQIPYVRSASRRCWRLKSCFLSAMTLSIALGVPPLAHAQALPPRQPLGIYYRMVIQPEKDADVTNSVMAALTNSAISGILAVFAWSDVSHTSSTNSPLVGTNDFHLLDAVFARSSCT
jgi:hypothetical protein